MLSDSNPILDISSVSVENQQAHGDSVFPYVICCNTPDAEPSSCISWIEENSDQLLNLANKHGAVLFRGFPLKTAEDFDTFVTPFDLPNFSYKNSLSNAVRVNRTERVFTANEAPSDVKILFHHEMAQTPYYPRTLFFFCEVAPDKGGATSVCRSDVLYDLAAKECPEFIKNCEELGFKYSNVMPGNDDPGSGMGRSWMSTLGINTKEEAEEKLRELNYSWEWMDDDCLRVTTPALPAVHEVSPGRKVLFNQLIAAFCGWKDSRNDPSEAIRHGDDSRLDVDAVMKIVDMAEEITFNVEWQAGDVVLVDNIIIMHGRQPFEGTRKVLASFATEESHSFVS